MEATTVCKVCGSNDFDPAINVREMMFGTREVFNYAACCACNCLQLLNVPEDLSVYYPAGYYSYDAKRITGDYSRFKWQKKRWRNRLLFSQSSLLHWCAGRFTDRFYKILAKHGLLRMDANILDVGCGSGELIIEMWKTGFTRLTGVDKFMPADVVYGNGITIHARELDFVQERFDVVMLHHTFEHVPDPQLMLRQVKERLQPGGIIVIRIPVYPAYAFEKYGADWVQLDAPRHLFLHSEKSMQVLAERTGLEIVRTEYDSTAFQFWGSEQYKRDIPLRSHTSFAENRGRSIFTRPGIRAFEKRARALNKEKKGDQALFVLKTRG